nr:hypothetical protein [Tanacetum cinerariifolium]
MSVKYPNYVSLTSSSEEQPNKRTPSPPPRKKSLSPPQAPSKSISSKSTHYTSSSSPMKNTQKDVKLQAFWSHNSMNSSDPNISKRHTKVEVPKELPKVSMDIVNIVLKSFVDNTSVNMCECNKCLELENEFLKKYFIEKETYDKFFRSYTTLGKHCISLEVDSQLNQEVFQRDNSISNQSAPSFDQYFELNELKAQSQEIDMVIKKLKRRIKSLSGNMNTNKVKKDIEEIETTNIELDHKVSKLIAKHEHLKQTYKQLNDSIKSTRVRSKEQCDALTNQVNLKSVEISDLNANLQDKSLIIAALKDK